jgi:hypothetical protein
MTQPSAKMSKLERSSVNVTMNIVPI